MNSPWRILADDLTGACDTGAVFAGRGWTVRVALSPQKQKTGAQVWSSESRGLVKSEAVLAVERVLNAQLPVQSGYFYKKIDSTLRGHPGAELAAVMRWLGVDRVLVCPAFPAQGRTVVHGQVLVDGVPLNTTIFAGEAAGEYLPDVFDFGQGCQLVPLSLVRQSSLAQTFTSPGIYAADAETQVDLENLARAGMQAGIRLFCGSAGLAHALLESISHPDIPNNFIPRPGGVLVAAGSRSVVTLRQVAALAAGGMYIHSLSHPFLSLAGDSIAAKTAELVCQRDLVLTVSGLEHQPGNEEKIAVALARLVAALLEKRPIGGLVLTGGDTASAVCSALGCTAIDLGGEVQPGLAWGYLADGQYAGMPVITKAGGFGEDMALKDAVRFLKKGEGLWL